MMVLNYVRADNWPEIHVLCDGSTDTLCGVDLDSAVPDAASAPAPFSEAAGGAHIVGHAPTGWLNSIQIDRAQQVNATEHVLCCVDTL